MKLYKIIFCFFIFTITPSLYSNFNFQGTKGNITPQGTEDGPYTNLSVSDQKLVTKMTFQYLNHSRLGTSEYEKAQKELQQFNRPVIGIVGQDQDHISYHEYQKKILGSKH